VGEEALGRVRFPAGLDIKAKRGDEIAVSILAEIIMVRRTIGDVEWSASQAGVAQEIAIDPICGMEVKIRGALHTFEHDGRIYYFCCGGCRARFASDPAASLAAG
jgi:xanthine/CO dehydrogenase XdhC/CoxF family maturation factor